MRNVTLVVSHNTFSKTNNMGKTLSALFYAADPAKVAQLYFKDEPIDPSRASAFFKITDGEMLRSTLKGKAVAPMPPTQITPAPAVKKARFGQLVQTLGAKRIPLIMLLRDWLWAEKYWFSSQLQDWLKENKPDCIFFASGDATFSYRVVLKLAETLNIPIVSYFCDDYYFYQRNWPTPGNLIYRYKIRKSIERLCQASTSLVTISKAMQEKYAKTFNRPTHLIMTPSQMPSGDAQPKGAPETVQLVYAGNIGMRAKTLLAVAKTVHALNKKGAHIRFEVYTLTADKKLIATLKATPGLVFMGALAPEQLQTVYQTADALLHVESFRKKDRARIKYSVSTKVPDLLMSGACIIAVGPEDQASMQYLKENQAAFVCHQHTDIEATIESFMDNPKLRALYRQKALQLAHLNHQPYENSVKLSQIIKAALQK